MLKKTTVLAIAVALLTTPALASAAGWTDTMGGVTKNLVKGENPHMIYSGSFSLIEPALGGIACPDVESTIKLTGGTNEADIETFKIMNPVSCHTSGFLKSICGTNSVDKGTLKSKIPPVLKISGGTEATLSGFEYEIVLTASCYTLLLKSEGAKDMTLKTNADTQFSIGTFGGTLDFGGTEPATVSGVGTLAPTKTFGISFP